MVAKNKIKKMFYIIFLFFCFSQNALSDDFSTEIDAADYKFILEQYEEAKEIYQKIIKSSDFSVVEAYAHYKLGLLYKREDKVFKAKGEYKKGLYSLQEAGESNHLIGKYILRELSFTG